MMSFMKYVNKYKYSNFFLVFLFFSTPLFLNNSINKLTLSQKLSYQPKEMTFDYFTITPPSKRRGIVLFENGKKKEVISLSNRVSAADVHPYEKYKGIATFLETDSGGTEPRRRLLKIRFNGINKNIGHIKDLPNKQERIASAKRQVGYAFLMFTIGIIWLLYVLYQFLNNQDRENSRIEQTN